MLRNQEKTQICFMSPKYLQHCHREDDQVSRKVLLDLLLKLGSKFAFCIQTEGTRKYSLSGEFFL